MDTDKISKLRIQEKDQIHPIERRRWRVWGSLILAAALGAAAFILHARGLLTTPIKVEVVNVNRVYPSQVFTDFNASGYVVAQRRASVASKGTGRLEHLAVREGSRVKEGDVLARLENEDLMADKAQIQAQLTAARAELIRIQTDVQTSERNFRRLRNLWQEMAVARADYDNARDQLQRSRAAVESGLANIKALEASLRRSNILIEYTVIRAPFDGVVLTKDADVGEVVAPFGSSLNAKAAVVTMADLSSLMVQADVSESSLPRVREEQPCEIQLDALPDTRLTGSVYTIVPTADRTRGTVLVKVQFDHLDPRVLPEMSARVAFLSRRLDEHERQPFLAVHRDALTERGGTQGLFRVDNERVTWVALQEPGMLGDFIRLDESWKPGERAVRRVPPDLEDGARVSLPE
jgi:RND family efflux transporter MFP subunit